MIDGNLCMAALRAGACVVIALASGWIGGSLILLTDGNGPRWGRFMLAVCLWAIAQIVTLIALEMGVWTLQTRHLALTLPAVVMAVTIVDIWRFFFMNGKH